MSAEFVPHNFNLFTHKPLVLSVQESSILECQSLNSLENASIIEFKSTGFNALYKDLSEVYLKLSVKLCKNDGTDFAETDLVQPNLENNALFSFFKSVYVTIGSTPVHSSESNHHYCQFIETVLSYDTPSADARLSPQMFFVQPTADKLGAITKNSCIVELYGKVQLINLDKLLIPMVDVNFRFNLEQPSFYIKEKSADGNAKLKFTDARLFIRHVQPINEISLTHEKMLTTRNAIYQGKRGIVVSQTIAKGLRNLNLPNFWHGISPHLLVCGFVENDAYVGTRNKSAYDFKNFNLSSFQFMINGSPFPKQAYNFKNDETHKSYSHVYAKMYEALGYSNTTRSCLVSQDSFLKNNFFLIHDNTQSYTALSDLQIPNSNTTIGVTGVFSKPLATSVTVLLYLLLPSHFEINGKREVKVIV